MTKDLRDSKGYTKLVTKLLEYVDEMDAFRALANGRAGIVYNLMEDVRELWNQWVILKRVLKV